MHLNEFYIRQILNSEAAHSWCQGVKGCLQVLLMDNVSDLAKQLEANSVEPGCLVEQT